MPGGEQVAAPPWPARPRSDRRRIASSTSTIARPSANVAHRGRPHPRPVRRARPPPAAAWARGGIALRLSGACHSSHSPSAGAPECHPLVRHDLGHALRAGEHQRAATVPRSPRTSARDDGAAPVAVRSVAVKPSSASTARGVSSASGGSETSVCSARGHNLEVAEPRRGVDGVEIPGAEPAAARGTLEQPAVRAEQNHRSAAGGMRVHVTCSTTPQGTRGVEQFGHVAARRLPPELEVDESGDAGGGHGLHHRACVGHGSHPNGLSQRTACPGGHGQLCARPMEVRRRACTDTRSTSLRAHSAATASGWRADTTSTTAHPGVAANTGRQGTAVRGEREVRTGNPGFHGLQHFGCMRGHAPDGPRRCRPAPADGRQRLEPR